MTIARQVRTCSETLSCVGKRLSVACNPCSLVTHHLDHAVNHATLSAGTGHSFLRLARCLCDTKQSTLLQAQRSVSVIRHAGRKIAPHSDTLQLVVVIPIARTARSANTRETTRFPRVGTPKARASPKRYR